MLPGSLANSYSLFPYELRCISCILTSGPLIIIIRKGVMIRRKEGGIRKSEKRRKLRKKKREKRNKMQTKREPVDKKGRKEKLKVRKEEKGGNENRRGRKFNVTTYSLLLPLPGRTTNRTCNIKYH